MKPTIDLCWTCQQNTVLMQRSANLPEGEKSERLKAAEKHLDAAREEQSYYHKVNLIFRQ